jgi:catechol 2,3-dioxygenase-like lactoylglutathione lyase family enzyme
VQTKLQHLQINVSAENMSFYKDLMTFLGWKTLWEAEGILGVEGTNAASLWFAAHSNGAANDYDGPGMNHLAIGAEAQADVDAAASYLKERGVALLFETPRHRPEFSAGEGLTYYQVMFASPDRILFEVVYTGPHVD